MAADFCIHVRTPECTDEIMEVFQSNSVGKNNAELWRKAYHIIGLETPWIFVDEVSWLFYTPNVVGELSRMIGKGIVVTDKTVKQMEDIYNRCERNGQKVIDFVNQHINETIFTVSW